MFKTTVMRLAIPFSWPWVKDKEALLGMMLHVTKANRHSVSCNSLPVAVFFVLLFCSTCNPHYKACCLSTCFRSGFMIHDNYNCINEITTK